MKIMIIRHADPDYEKDSLTPAGWEEAKLLAEQISRLDIKAFYVSPMGRAQDTAGCTLKKMNRTAKTLDWLREFSAEIDRPDRPGTKSICWDWLPQDWTAESLFLNVDTWTDHPSMIAGDVKKEYQWLCGGLDALLYSHGYERKGRCYRVRQANSDTIALFCHYGSGCAILSHLLNISPILLWHGFVAAPSSVTVVRTEERRKGIAAFRVSSYGDTSHLYVNGREPSVSARFCECFDNAGERHD